MALNVEKYQCEWKTTLESPEKLKRFSHFINSSKVDDSVKFVEVRDQIRPATEEEKSELIAVG
jgi:nitrite reductase (NADH) large subunit